MNVNRHFGIEKHEQAYRGRMWVCPIQELMPPHGVEP